MSKDWENMRDTKESIKERWDAQEVEEAMTIQQTDRQAAVDALALTIISKIDSRDAERLPIKDVVNEADNILNGLEARGFTIVRRTGIDNPPAKGYARVWPWISALGD